MNVSTAAPAPTPTQPLPVLTLLTHVDATPSDLQPFETAEIESMERSVRPDTNLLVQLRREASNPLWTIARGVLQLAPLAVVPMLGLSGPLSVAANIGSYMLASSGMRNVVDGIRNVAESGEPAWNATRIYKIGKDVERKKLDSPILAETKDTSANVPAFTKYLVDNMKQYPAQVTAVMVGGHGLAWKDCANFKIRDLGKALKDATAQAGKKPDVLILEACLMGNLEALRTLQGTARYAIASEETMGASGLNWKSILSRLPQNSMTAEQFTRVVMDASRRYDQVDTLAVIDLDKVEPLAQSVEVMARELRRVAANGDAGQVKDALKSGQRFPAGVMGFGSNLRDVGQIAHTVSVSVSDPAARAAAKNVEAAIKAAVLSSVTEENYRGVSHLSIQCREGGIDTQKYARETGMKEWAGLLEDTKPWYRKIF
ncbi:MAG: hypothetical protein FJX76_25240 [Armatimonadetes bacterium]|nr:hypothetical protein [Armatimonadota bacterium]